MTSDPPKRYGGRDSQGQEDYRGISVITAHKPKQEVDHQTVLERCLHVVALSSLTVAQPLLDLGARHAEFFVAHGFSRSDIGWFIFTLLLLVPLPALAVEILLARAPRIARAAHGLIIAIFAALFWIVVVKRIGFLPGAATLALAALAGLLTAGVYLRARWLRFFVTALAVAPLVVPAVFLASPQIRQITWARNATFLELPSVASTAPIVFIVFDEFSSSVLLDEKHEINPLRYPNLAALARKSSWFPNAVSVAEITESALPAILTGNYPEVDKLPTIGEYPHNLFTLFGGGYDIWAQEPITELCPVELNLLKDQAGSRIGRFTSIAADVAIVYLHVILPETFAARLPTVSGAWRDFAAQRADAQRDRGDFFVFAIDALRRDRRDEFERFTSAIRKRSRPGLYFLHILLPHRPWELLQDGQRYPDGEHIPGLRRATWLSNEYLVQQAYQRYLLQVQFVDTAIGRVVRRLEDNDLFDRSLLVLLGDHGTSFRANGEQRLVDETNDHDIIPVPLLIKAPGQHEGRVLSHPVRVIDILPTMLDLLEVEAPWPMEGRSGFDPADRDLRFVTKERGTIDVDPAIYQEMRDTVRWKLELFGTGEDPLDIYRLGPDGDLVGRRSRELAHGGSEGWTVEVNSPERYQTVTTSDDVPVLMSGFVAGPEAEPCCRLAVALNGTVSGTTQTHEGTGPRREFSVVLPVDAFRDGANHVEIFRISESDGEVGLVPIQAAK